MVGALACHGTLTAWMHRVPVEPDHLQVGGSV